MLGRMHRTFDFLLIHLGISHQKRRCLAVERIRWVGVSEELGQEDFEDIDHVEHGRPSLINDVEAYRAGTIIVSIPLFSQ